MERWTHSLAGFLANYCSLFIFGSFIVSVVCLIFSNKFAKIIIKDLDRDDKKKAQLTYYRFVAVTYTVFHALASILPLLGMLGTVVALLEIDLNGDLDTVKNSFFLALDTTMWGLFFSILLKIGNSFVQTRIEDAEDKARELYKRTYF